MKSAYNYIGVFAWIIVFLLLVFIIQNIRKRHIKMIVMDHVRFSVKNLVLDILEIVVWGGLLVSMSIVTFFDNPSLNDHARITDSVKFRPLIMTVDQDKSFYVKVNTVQSRDSKVEYTLLSDGNKITINGANSSISDGASPLSPAASAYPFDEKVLVKMDQNYQKAYLATYVARYKKNWRNGLGLSAGRVATEYYLIRIPDQTFVKDQQTK